MAAYPMLTSTWNWARYLCALTQSGAAPLRAGTMSSICEFPNRDLISVIDNHPIFRRLTKDTWRSCKLRVMHRTFSPFLPDLCLGYVDLSIDDIISRCAEAEGKDALSFEYRNNSQSTGNAIFNFRNPKDRSKLGSIELFVVKQATPSVGGLAVAGARRAAEEAQLLHTDSGQLLGAAPTVIDPAVSLANVVSKLEALGKVVQTISKAG
jgi:hypothetical protein